MNKSAVAISFLLMSSSAVFAAGPNSATYISAADIQKVLKASKALDQNIRTIEMGQGYQMSVAVVQRDATLTTAAQAPANRPIPARAPCGVAAAQGNDTLGPNGVLSHDDTAETYIVTEGSGTLVTGGYIVNGGKYPADSALVTTMNGPTCGGKIAGGFKTQTIGVGDIIVIPAGVPHGFVNIPQGGIKYLSVRPDPKYVLPRNYVIPALRNGG